MSPLEHAEQIIAQVTWSPLNLRRYEWKHINPAVSMVARRFLSWLRDETVLARVAHAQSVDDLKALLVVDDYLSRVKHIESRRQIQQLLEDPEIPLDLIEVYAALTYLREALFVADEMSVPERVELELDRFVYTAAAAARHLGWNTEELYDAMARSDVQAELCIRLGELLRVRRQADTIRYASSSPAPSDDPSAEPTS